jgi:thiamine-monophosphate kinase
MKCVNDIGEDALIAQLLAQLPPAPQSLHVGPGDDCAVVPFSSTAWQLLKTDAIVEGVHFLSNENIRRVGWKAIARVVSDFAAMGGAPQWFLVTLGIPSEASVDLLVDLYQGMADCLQKYGATMVGGETSRVESTTGLVISIAATGTVKKKHLLLRSTARCDDLIFVTGQLGGSLAGRHLDIEPRLAEGQWLAQQHFATAMMDLSDGLAKDLPRLAKASSIGFMIDLDQIPRTPGRTVSHALQDGEDYELLFTVAPAEAKRLMKKWRKFFPATKLTCIGRIVPSEQSMELSGGWDHFPSRKR